MKNNKILQNISLLLTLFPIIAYGFYYNALPEQIPSHWDFAGNIDGYSTKTEFSLLALLPLIMCLTFIILPKIDPKKENYQKFSGFFQGFNLVMVIFMDLIFFLCLYSAFHQESDVVSKVVPISVGILLLFIGNYLPKVKPNFFMGIKTPWTLSSETVWIKTHRKGGFTFMLLGIFMMIIPFLPPLNSYIFATVVLLASFYPMALSYFYFVQEKKNEVSQ